jgi:2',3'-cyclic-nucleotide 2'-phosphodiesterase (5'-nucleotidase family)/predicted AlkP superfamily phosphohydrolase/phosphomutase
MRVEGRAGHGRRRTRIVGVIAAAAVAAGLTVPWVGAEASRTGGHHGHHAKDSGKLLFFASDGLVQNRVEEFSDDGDTPGFRELLRKGTRASDNGLLTQSPPNTGAGWFTLATGAWPGIHGSTNNTFHINGNLSASGGTQTFGSSRTAAFDNGVLQAETLAQAAERAGKRVAQIEWAGGRGGAINGPTLDYRNFRSGRGVATNYIAPEDSPTFTASFGLQFDHPSGFAGNNPFPAAAPSPATGWTKVPKSYSPAKEMRLRVLDGLTPNTSVDKYGLNAYIYDSRNDRKTRYDRVLLSKTKSGDDAVGNLEEGEWADVKVTLNTTDALNGKTGAFLVKVERLESDLSKVRLFHTSVTRAIATWNGWSERGFTGTFEDFVAERFPSSQAGDFAVLEAGIVSEETYIEQGEYWEESYHPLIKYVLDKHRPDLAMVGYPVTDEVQHQFLGLVTRKLPNGQNNPAYDDVNLDGKRDNRVKQRERFIREAYEGSDETMRLAQKHLRDHDLTTFVGSDHGFAAQFLAIDASKVLVDLGLLSHPQTSNCRLATGETIGKAKACFAGGTVQVYLNLSGRDPAGGFRQIGAPASTNPPLPAEESEASAVARIKAAFQNVKDTNDWTHDGKPENWKVIDRVFTKAEARYIPNGAGQTADMAHPTRTGDVIAFSYPPYQFDAATPGTLIAPSAFFGQHGYVPDVQDLRSNTNMRATFIAGGDRIDRGVAKNVRSIDLAPTAAFLLGVPVPQHSQGVVRRDIIDDGDDFTPVNIVGLNDFHGQLAPAATTLDANTAVSVGGAAQLATLFDEEMAKLPGQSLLLAAGDNVGASPPASALLEDVPAIDVENAWGLDATSFGNHEFDFGIERILKHQARANFPFLATNVVETATGKEPPWMETSAVFRVNGVRVGVIGSVVRNTPELVKPGNTAGLEFLDEAERIRRESAKLRAQGVRVQLVVIHEGATTGANAIDGRPATPWAGPIVGIVEKLQDTTVDLVIAGHTHRAANTVIGRIPVVEGFNAGISYSVAQLMVDDGDVEWAGAATRLAKNLGVAQRPDVKAIVDKAVADTAPLLNVVIGEATVNLLRDNPDRLRESSMGNFVADAMRLKYADDGVQAAITNSGGLRADIPTALISGDEEAGEITWGEAFAVLPFGNATVIETVTYEQLVAALTNGFRPPCGDSSGGTGRTPQFSGLWVEFSCNGNVPVINNVWLAPPGPRPTTAPLGPGASVRIVTNDFMFGGGDGYTALSGGTDVLQTGDLLLDVMIEYIENNSPITTLPPAGRRAGPFS